MIISVNGFTINMQHHGLFRANLEQSKNKIGMAERKILIVFVYYVVVIVLIVLGSTLRVREREEFTSQISCYFQCESKGVDPNNPCDTSGIFNPAAIIMSTVSFVLLALFPLANFIFVLNTGELRKRCEELLPCLFKRTIKVEEVNTTTSSKNSTTDMLVTSLKIS